MQLMLDLTGDAPVPVVNPAAANACGVFPDSEASEIVAYEDKREHCMILLLRLESGWIWATRGQYPEGGWSNPLSIHCKPVATRTAALQEAIAAVGFHLSRGQANSFFDNHAGNSRYRRAVLAWLGTLG